MKRYFSVTTAGKKMDFVSAGLTKYSLAGFMLILAVTFVELNSISLAQSSDYSQHQRQTLEDIKTEIPLIQEIEATIDPIVKSKKLTVKNAERLRVALDEFEKFQQGNGGNYVVGYPGNAFHEARNLKRSISNIFYGLKPNGRRNIPKESRNALVFWKDRLTKVRTRLLRMAEDIEAELKGN